MVGISIRSRITEIDLAINYMVQVCALSCQDHSDLEIFAHRHIEAFHLILLSLCLERMESRTPS